MGRHSDANRDGIADHADPNHEDYDPAQREPDRWVGVTRDADALPISPDEYDPESWDE